MVIKKLFAPSSVDDDKEFLIAELLKLNLLVIFAGIILHTIYLFFFTALDTAPVWSIIAIFSLIVFLSMWVVSRWLRLAAILFVILLWFFTTLFVWAYPDNAVMIAAYGVCIFIISLLFGKWRGLYCAVLSVSAHLSIWWASVNRLLPAAPLPHTHLLSVNMHLVAWGMAIVLLHVMTQNFTRALARSGGHERALAELNHALQWQRQELACQEVAFNRHLAEAQEAERKRLAHELHDRVGQNLTALDFILSTMRLRLSTHDSLHEEFQMSITDALALAQQTNEVIRDVLVDLRPPVFGQDGLDMALQWYLSILTKRTGLPIHFSCDANLPVVAEPIKLALFRITQEAFTNIIKHADASACLVSLTCVADTLQLIIHDNGRGFMPEHLSSADSRPGWGLLTMQERMTAVGGYCRIESEPGQGTQVIVAINLAVDV